MTPGAMRLLRIPEPFDHTDFLYEVKHDGFRAIEYIEGRDCRLVSRNGYTFKAWPQLADEIARTVSRASAVLDGEVCCLEPDGRTDFYRLMVRRDRPFFYAFDLLAMDGQDLTTLPLRERKRRLRALVPRGHSPLLYVDAIAERGTDLFRLACQRDLEGIVAKWSKRVYQCDGSGTSWLKIKNPAYMQMDGRRELFEARRDRRHQSKQRTITPQLVYA
jgi:bifunctional non-homologous end joining protein LigD